jgi:hypothetical protein
VEKKQWKNLFQVSLTSVKQMRKWFWRTSLFIKRELEVFVKPSCGEEAVEKSFPDESSHA